MPVEPITAEAASAEKAKRSETRFPSYGLAESVEVARLIHTRGGGAASADQLASYLGYKSTNNGAYLARVSAARSFALINRNGEAFIPSDRAHKILSPTYPADQKRALVEAFFEIPLFKKVYDDFKGKELPPEFGMKNALRTQHGVIAGRIDVALKVLMESAETAGFFETRGAKTHLIPPLLQVPPVGSLPPAPQTTNDDAEHGGGGGNDGGDNPPPKPPAQPQLADAKALYVGALIKMFDVKVSKGEFDDKLMERIERLLGEQA